VTAGQASITTSGAAMTIKQSSAKAIIDWRNFDIGAGAAVRFNQPGRDAVTLNRVVGQDPSAIYGSLTAVGQVFLVNPNGILFAQGARADVGGLVASTMGITNQDFLAGNYRFTRNGTTNAVVNQGELTGRYVALLGPQVSNEGVITASMGTAALASGEAVTLGITGEDLVSVKVDQARLDTLVQNKGLIRVDGGTAILSAQSAAELLGQVVNTGQIAADGISLDGGVVRLTASGAIDQSGAISADAGADGRGGQVSVIASLDNPSSLTTLSGTISARGGARSGDGGAVETSATHLKITDGAKVDTTAPHGATGSWLLDPYDFTIAAANGDITGAALSTALGSSDVTITTSDTSAACTGVAGCGTGSSSGNGDINVNDAVNWGSAHTLTLSAWRNVNINAPITVSGTGTLALEFGQAGALFDFVPGAYLVNAPVNLASGAGFSVKAFNDGTATPYTVITTAAILANTGLTGNYVLGGNIDVSAIASWTPIGTLANPFIGMFDGLGHQVQGLTHPNGGSDTEVGLFGAVGPAGAITNVGVTGVNIAGSQNVGALVGYNAGGVANSWATGSVTGSGAGTVGGIGGLIGYSDGPIAASYANVTVSATTGDQSSTSPYSSTAHRGAGGIGGLVGVASGNVWDSYATGAVTGNNAVGGLVGYSNLAYIKTTYSTGLVTGATVGSTAATNVGGLVGQVSDPSSGTPWMFNSFWDVTTSGQSSTATDAGDSGNVHGLTTSQMKTTSNFTGDWATDGAWELRSGQYPLLWQMLRPIYVVADNKTTTYNGSPVTGFTATIGPAGTSSALYSGSVTITPSTASPTNAATYTLTPSGLTLANPGDQQGYRLVYTPGSLTINAAALAVTINGALIGAYSKTYDGTADANGLTSGNFSLTGWLAGDGATVTKTTGQFDDADAGTGKNITVTLSLSDFHANVGTTLSNYILPTTVHGSIGTIDKAPLNVTVGKTYDGSNAFSSGFTFTGMVHGDAAPTVASGSATVSSADAATYTSFASNGLTLSNGNYTLTGGTVSAKITPKALDALTLSSMVDPPWNAVFSLGSTFTAAAAATLDSGTGGILSRDGPLTLSGSTTFTVGGGGVNGVFAVTAKGDSLSLSGKGSGNYTLTGTSVSATVRPSTAPAAVVNVQQRLATLSNPSTPTSSNQQLQSLLASMGLGGSSASPGGSTSGGSPPTPSASAVPPSPGESQAPIAPSASPAPVSPSATASNTTPAPLSTPSATLSVSNNGVALTVLSNTISSSYSSNIVISGNPSSTQIGLLTPTSPVTGPQGVIQGGGLGGANATINTTNDGNTSMPPVVTNGGGNGSILNVGAGGAPIPQPITTTQGGGASSQASSLLSDRISQAVGGDNLVTQPITTQTPTSSVAPPPATPIARPASGLITLPLDLTGN
jgi:filamentous hemagglutinin family protein